MALSTLLYFFVLPVLVLFLTQKLLFTKKSSTSHSHPHQQSPDLPGTYLLVGSLLSLRAHTKDQLEWLTSLLRSSPTSTVVAHLPFWSGQLIFTANPANIEHILKANFSSYPKGTITTSTMGDLFGRGLSNVDGSEWKYQREISSHVFSTKSLRKFVETVVDKELKSRLLPFAEGAARSGQVVDFQDILRRFGFDNICEIAFGYDPECLLPDSLPDDSWFAHAYDAAAEIMGQRLTSFFPPLWRLKRFLNIGSERELKKHVAVVRGYAQSIARKKITNSQRHGSTSDHDLLSRFIVAGHKDELFLTDIMMTFIHAGRDTTSAALTWFFWLISQHPGVEQKILDEIKSMDNNNSSFQQARRDMMYTQAALFESMRLYPPIPLDGKQAADNNTLPDGTVVETGTTVVYHIYAMGRMESIWGHDCLKFKPERWLVMVDREEDGCHDPGMEFVSKDPYTYPVFHGGPRMCLGKEMAVLQMKRIVAQVLKRFSVVPAAIQDGFQPIYVQHLTAEMEGGFPVKFVERN